MEDVNTRKNLIRIAKLKSKPIVDITDDSPRDNKTNKNMKWKTISETREKSSCDICDAEPMNKSDMKSHECCNSNNQTALLFNYNINNAKAKAKFVKYDWSRQMSRLKFINT